MKFKIKVTYDFDEEMYHVFVDRLQLEGWGKTEAEAVENFKTNYDVEMRKD